VTRWTLLTCKVTIDARFSLISPKETPMTAKHIGIIAAVSAWSWWRYAVSRPYSFSYGTLSNWVIT
jgi:hypothetical protein